MIHYTIIPEELIFAEDEEQEVNQRLIEMNGLKFLVEPSGETSFKIVQLISTNPQDYLNEKYQPGQMLSLKPAFDN